MDTTEDLQRSPLFDAHVSLKARMVPFSGWEMPIQYGSILAEARAVRSNAGVFDVSHMGRVEIEGPGAASFLDRLLSVDVPGLRIGRARYNLICNEEGGIIDDCIVYRRGEESFLLVPNGSNRPTVLEWLDRWAPGRDEVRIDDITLSSGMVAAQGPDAAGIIDDLAGEDLSSMRPSTIRESRIAGADIILTRTGYTGEDGFELMVPGDSAADLWRMLTNKGAEPCGLGARDVLRIEAGLPLHGNDISLLTNPYEAGLDRFVNPDREGYIAGDALRRVRDRGVDRSLVGFTMVERGIPRQDYAIMDGARELGRVTSGGHSPTLDTSIGLGYVPKGYTDAGTRFQIDIRGRSVEAEVTRLPFYSRKRIV